MCIGHGGLMDRMDCILLMIFFTSFYYRTYISTKIPSVGSIISMIMKLNKDDQIHLLMKLKELTE